MNIYYLCDNTAKKALTTMYDYFAFDGKVSFNDFMTLISKNIKAPLKFPNELNATIEHIVSQFWMKYPQYRSNGYIKSFWLTPEEAIDAFTQGTEKEFDPDGVIRQFTRENFSRLVALKPKP